MIETIKWTCTCHCNVCLLQHVIQYTVSITGGLMDDKHTHQEVISAAYIRQMFKPNATIPCLSTKIILHYYNDETFAAIPAITLNTLCMYRTIWIA